MSYPSTPQTSPPLGKIPKYILYINQSGVSSWPQKCTLCMTPQVSRTDKVSDSYDVESYGPVKKVHKVSLEGIPYCETCWKKTHNYLLILVEIIVAVFIGIGIAFAFGPKFGTNLEIVQTILSGAIPGFIIFAVLYVGLGLSMGAHSAVTVTANPKGTKINFRNFDYANEFATINLMSIGYRPCPTCGRKLFVNSWDNNWYCLACDS